MNAECGVRSAESFCRERGCADQPHTLDLPGSSPGPATNPQSAEQYGMSQQETTECRLGTATLLVQVNPIERVLDGNISAADAEAGPWQVEAMMPRAQIVPRRPEGFAGNSTTRLHPDATGVPSRLGALDGIKPAGCARPAPNSPWRRFFSRFKPQLQIP